MRCRAALLLLCSLLFACERPRDRACRSLVLQAADADAARTTATPDARIAAYRAQSAARWLRSNAVADADLKEDAMALASALDRLADARLRIADASDALGAPDAAELVARSERVLAYVAARDHTSSIRMKPCPYYEPHSLIDDPRCLDPSGPPGCEVGGSNLPLALHANRCADLLDRAIENAAVPSEVTDLASSVRATAAWAKILPPRTVEETVAAAQMVSAAVADRGRAEADITRLTASLGTKCGP